MVIYSNYYLIYSIYSSVVFFQLHWFMVILGMLDTGMTTLDGNRLWNQRTCLEPLSWWGYLHGSVSTASEPVTQEGGAIDLPGWRGEGRVEVTEDPGPSVCRYIVFMQIVFEYLFITEKAEPCSVWKYFAKLCDCGLRLLKVGTAKAHWNSLTFIESRFDPGVGAPENARLLVDRDPLLTLTSYYANLKESLPTNKGGFC